MKIGLCLVAALLLPFTVSSSNPETSMSLRSVIEIVADYEIHHPVVPYVTTWYGLTDYDNQIIFAIRSTDIVNRRLTMIHELFHVDRRLRGIQLDNYEDEEAAVKEEAARMYRQLFGNVQ